MTLTEGMFPAKLVSISISGGVPTYTDFAAADADTVWLLLNPHLANTTDIKWLAVCVGVRPTDGKAIYLATEYLPDIYGVARTIGGRLTLSSSDPRGTGTAQGTIYYLPYVGRHIHLPTSSALYDIGASGVSCDVPNNANTVFDVFAIDSGGALDIETTNWTNDTTRATAIEYHSTHGYLVKSGSTDKRYLGTGRTLTAAQCTMNGTDIFHLWNMYNQQPFHGLYSDGTGHTYGTATWREWNGATNTHWIRLVNGLQIRALVAITGTLYNAGTAAPLLGVELDSAGSPVDSLFVRNDSLNTILKIGATQRATLNPGYHSLRIIEIEALGTGTAAFDNAVLTAEFWG